MTSSDMPKSDLLAGTFIVDLPGQRRTGLAAHEVSLLLETPEGREAVIYRVHRVSEEGRMELVGVAPAAFRRQECIVYLRREVRDARQDMDAIESHAASEPPPCRLELRLARNPGGPWSSMTAVVFPAVCADAVTHWLGRAGRSLGEENTGGASSLDQIEMIQVVRHVVLEPRARHGGSPA